MSAGTVAGAISGKRPNEMDQAINGAAGQPCLTSSFIIVCCVSTQLVLGLDSSYGWMPENF